MEGVIMRKGLLEKLFLMLGISLSSILFVSGSFAKTDISIGTGTVGGSFHAIGMAVAESINKNQDQYNMTAQVTAGTVENLRLLDKDRISLGVVSASVGYLAYWAKEPFEKKPIKYNAVMTLHPNPNFFVVLRSSGIKDIMELKGKRVHTGAAGGGSEVAAKIMLEGCGITYKDFTPVFLGFGQAQEALLDGAVDAACLFTPITRKVNASQQIDILSLSHEQMDNIIKMSPCFSKYEFPPNYFKNIDYPVWALDYGVQLVCQENADPEMIYHLTKTLVDNASFLGTVYAPAKVIDEQWAAKDYGVPYHPGALKYYKELGVVK
jgi:uncharacterized protein